MDLLLFSRIPKATASASTAWPNRLFGLERRSLGVRLASPTRKLERQISSLRLCLAQRLRAMDGSRSGGGGEIHSAYRIAGLPVCFKERSMKDICAHNG